MTRDEIALKLIVTALKRNDAMVQLTNPRPLTWTTLPPPAIYILIDNALWIADNLLKENKEK